MKTKTFKIGEYCKGGIITVEIHDDTIIVIGKDWDYSTGTRRNSNQKNAKEWTRFSIKNWEADVEWKLDLFIVNLTTSYYTDQILTWIKSQINLDTQSFW